MLPCGADPQPIRPNRTATTAGTRSYLPVSQPTPPGLLACHPPPHIPTKLQYPMSRLRTIAVDPPGRHASLLLHIDPRPIPLHSLPVIVCPPSHAFFQAFDPPAAPPLPAWSSVSCARVFVRLRLSASVGVGGPHRSAHLCFCDHTLLAPRVSRLVLRRSVCPSLSTVVCIFSLSAGTSPVLHPSTAPATEQRYTNI